MLREKLSLILATVLTCASARQTVAQELRAHLTLKAHGSALSSLVFCHDGKTLISGSTDKTVRLWNIPEGSLSKTLLAAPAAIMSLAINKDDKQIAVCPGDESIIISDINTGKSSNLASHTYFGAGMAFSPDGRILAAASSDQTVKLFESGSWKVWKSFKGPKKM